MVGDMIRIKRTRNREYRTENSGGGVTSRQFTPSEYAVVDGKQLVARIVFMGEGWRVCQATERSLFGRAVSPVGMNRFKEVREWALLKYGDV
jgi:hypothetical protein